MNVASYDVVCLGGGGAGVTAAVAAARAGAAVALVSKEPIGYGDTRIAGGFMVYPGLIEGDSPQVLLEDMLKAGDYINNLELARLMCEKAREATVEVEGFGHLFRRDQTGAISGAVADPIGGHSFARAVSCPPGNGMAIGNALRSAVMRLGFAVYEEAVACRLLVNDGEVAGVIICHMPSGEIWVLETHAAVVATGGAGWLYYPHTDCTRGTTGDGYSLALGVGAELVDMEQVQFMPFSFTHPASVKGVYIGEPRTAGPYGVLRNARGRVILAEINSRTRAQVSKVMALELASDGGTGNDGLLLDLSANLDFAEGLEFREAMRSSGQLDAVRRIYGTGAYRFQEPWDVAPTAHYTMGGIQVDTQAESKVPGLFAAGQAMGGLHGGNRLGSVSLAELFVFGRLAGEGAARKARKTRACRLPADVADKVKEIGMLFGSAGENRPITLKRRLQALMWKRVGLVREKNGLAAAVSEIDSIEKEAERLSVARTCRFNLDFLDAVELKHMLAVSRCIASAALKREETRGAHVRLDFPETDDRHWRKNIVQRLDRGNLETRCQGVKRM